MPIQSRVAAEVVDRYREPHGHVVEETRIVYFDTPAWAALCEWVKVHGIDPMKVLVGTLVRDAVRYGIGYTHVENKQVRHQPDGSLLAVSHQVFEQGEAPPLPLPAEVLAIAPEPWL